MGRGWDTDALLGAAQESLKRSKVDGRLISLEDVSAVWKSVGTFVEEALEGGKPVQIAKFGSFTFLQKPLGPSGRGEPEKFLALAPDFLSTCGVRSRRGGKVESTTAVRLNFIGLSRFAKRSKDVCRKVIEAMTWALTSALAKGADYVQLEFPGLGCFECQGKVCDFSFGQGSKRPARGSDIVGQDEEDEVSEHPEEDEEEGEASDAEVQEASSVRATEVRRMVIPESIDRLREKCKQRGVNGIHSLSRQLRIMDSSGDGQLDKNELKYGLADFGIRINSAELDEMFAFFDRDRSGKISFDEFLVGLRGPMSSRRVELIKLAFSRLDRTGDGQVTMEDLEQTYDTSADPDVKSGKKKPAEALREFLKQFDTIEQDGIVTQEEFIEYYKSVSASIDSDDYFELMIRNAWHISGGKGQYENTSNRRVLVTHKDGSQTVEEVKDDLWVQKSDQAEMKRRIASKDVVGNLGLTYASDQTKPSSKALPGKLQASASKKTDAKAARDPFANAGGAGDESMAPVESTQDLAAAKTPEPPMVRLSKLLTSRRMKPDEFLLKLGANRVFGNPSIDIAHFERGLVKFDPAFSKSDAQDIARIVDADQSGKIDVAELIAHIQGTAAVDRIKAAVLARGGMNGIASLSRVLRVMDQDGNKSLDRREVQEGFANFGVKLTSKDVDDVFAKFDRDRSGSISFDEFLVGMRGPMNKRRTDLVRIAFKRLDRSGDGKVTVEDLEGVYDPTHHPDFKAGTKTRKEVLREFLDTFDEGADKDGIVTEEEFLDYYASVSASIDNDDYFELMIRNAWHISGGQGWCENTSNRRVLVTDADGNQTVQEVKDDLWVSKDDTAEIRKRLCVKADAKVDFTYGSDSTDKAKKSKPTLEQLRHVSQLGPNQSAASTLSASAWGKKPSSSLVSPRKTKAQKANPFNGWGSSGAGDEALPEAPPQSPAVTLRPRGAEKAQGPSTDQRVGSAKSSDQRKQQQQQQQRQAEPVALERLRARVVERGGTNGIHTLGRVLKIMDTSGDNNLDKEELKYGLADYGVQCSESELQELFRYLDKDKSGKVSFDEFLNAMRGPLPKRRLDLIAIAFQRLDRTGDGVVTVEDLETVYDPSFHPEVQSGKLTKAQALREFLKQFDTIDQDGVVTGEEFIEYYKSVSASIDSDDYFELMMRNAWHISGGKGQCENTSNRRVLVTRKDGSQSVEEVKDDLWVGKDDQAEMKRRIGKAAQDSVGNLGLHFASDNTQPAMRTRPVSKVHQTSIDLSWEDPADKLGISPDQLNRKVALQRERERKIRSAAASRLQALARSAKAKKSVTIEKNKKFAASMNQRDEEQDRLKASKRILRPGNNNIF